jgi:hypothetical protein
MVEFDHGLTHVKPMQEHGSCSDGDLTEFEYVADCFDELTSFAAVRLFHGQGDTIFVDDTWGCEDLGIREEPLRTSGGKEPGWSLGSARHLEGFATVSRTDVLRVVQRTAY